MKNLNNDVLCIGHSKLLPIIIQLHLQALPNLTLPEYGKCADDLMSTYEDGAHRSPLIIPPPPSPCQPHLPLGRHLLHIPNSNHRPYHHNLPLHINSNRTHYRHTNTPPPTHTNSSTTPHTYRTPSTPLTFTTV
ncbi:hypothetical protein Pcinc_005094 [Petrolisthes cinctipes]|uniref:Uncharacterized protein n=1 Tax=Petrolisthes cinctipes TaxID=88211 RepID=A0AAE1GFP1_PETCI|nr:hypothetical protein Pcinc_005094 [Petrolisthes cinctipes]